MKANQWRRVTIQQLLDERVVLVQKDGNHGSNYPRKSEFSDSGVLFLTAKSLDDKGGAIDFENAPRLGFEKANKIKFGYVEQGDVLLSHNATVGRVAVVPAIDEPILIGTSLTHFRVNRSLLIPKFLAAYFKGIEFQNELKSVMSHTTRNQVPITAQRRLHVALPPISIQRAIAKILGTLDDKIELNRRMNETLESIARAIYKSWFVHFDPVRAKLEGQLHEQQSRAFAYQMPAEVYDLFPSAFQDSELGKIPEGWEVTPVSSAFDINPKRLLKKGVEAKYLDMKNVPTSGHRPDQIAIREFKSGTKFENGDTLLARITPCLENGKTAFVDFLDEGEIAGGSTEFIVIRPKDPLPDE